MTDRQLHDFVQRVEWEPEHDKEHGLPCFDEMVAGPVDYVHIERMDNDHYWMAIGKGERRQVVRFHTRGAMLFARTEKD